MSDETPDSLIPYDEIVQEALRAVVGRVLGAVERGGGVLQNKFWELAVDDDGFQVGLSFNQIPAKLQIPFAAITAFVDPAVDFGLQFHAAVADIEPAMHEDAENDAPEAEAERGDTKAVASEDDGSNVVTVDFGRKK